MEKILHRNEARRRPFTDSVRGGKLVADVDSENDVYIAEISGANVKRFRAHEFLGDTGKDLERTGQTVLGHEFLQH